MPVDSSSNILSIGIDIGTTTTHLTISRLGIANVSSAFRVPRLCVSRREIIYQSPVYFTPLREDDTIDGDKVGQILITEYARAGVDRGDVTSGAAIITGESASCSNAREAVQQLAALAGDFVVATAGANLESILAGKGSGAAAASARRHNTICNVDIGGGTTNIAVFSAGRLMDTACIGIGGRCLVFDEAGRVKKITDSGNTFFDAVAKLQYICEGRSLQDEQLELYGALLAEAIVAGVVNPKPPQVSQRLFITELLQHNYKIDEVWLSGGVASLIGSDTPELHYNDMGVFLARALGQSLDHHGVKWHVPDLAVRATVLGAGMHTMQLSGSTIAVDSASLPLHNIPVVKVSMQELETWKCGALLERITAALSQHDLDRNEKAVAISFDTLPSLSFEFLQWLANELCSVRKRYVLVSPIVVLMPQDVAMALGQLIRAREPDCSAIILDGIITEYGDFIDIGRTLPSASTVPVVVKTLVFNESGFTQPSTRY